MKRFVIPDIHGCPKTLLALLDKIGLSPSDELYFLGDFIDKGKDSAGVLDIVIELIAGGYQVFPIRGNHEENLLYAHQHYNPKMLKGFVARLNKSGNLLDADGAIIPKYLDFIKALPYHYELDDFWIVHAGFNTKRVDFLEDKLAMLETRAFTYDDTLLKSKRVIHGHQVTYAEDIAKAIAQEERIVPLDNGCVYSRPHKRYDFTQTGQLNCLELDTMNLVQVKNVDNL